MPFFFFLVVGGGLCTVLSPGLTQLSELHLEPFLAHYNLIRWISYLQEIAKARQVLAELHYIDNRGCEDVGQVAFDGTDPGVQVPKVAWFIQKVRPGIGAGKGEGGEVYGKSFGMHLLGILLQFDLQCGKGEKNEEKL